MQATRENKIVLEFEGNEQISLLKAIIEKLTPKSSSLKSLMIGSKPKFSSAEKQFISELSDNLERL